MKKCWCGNTDFEDYSDNYYKCPKCKTLVSKLDINYDENNIHDNGEDFYGKAYWQEKMLQAAGCNSLDEVVDLYLEGRAVYWLKNFLRYRLPFDGKVAEVGCGLGQFSYYLKQLGFAQTAFELSPEICQYIRENMRINVKCGGMSGEENEYSAIAAFDVLEHLIEPIEFLLLANKLLKDDGILFFQTPCYDATLNYDEMRVQKGKFQQQLLEKEHVYLYSKDSVTNILHKCGFHYIEFMDAYFGNDYDMFFVASRSKINVNEYAKIKDTIKQKDNGQLICTLINLWDKLKFCDQDREDRLQQILKLTSMYKDIEQIATDRACQIEKLTDIIHDMQRKK